MKYHCFECKHIWDGDDFTLDCPQCRSTEIDIYKGPDKSDATQSISPSDSDAGKTQKMPAASDKPEKESSSPNISGQATQKLSASKSTDSKSTKDYTVPKSPSPEKSDKKSTPPPPPQAPSPAKKGNGGLIFGLLLLIILVGGGLYYFLYLGDDEPSKEEQEPPVFRIKENNQAFFLEAFWKRGVERENIAFSNISGLYRASDSLPFAFDKESGQILFCEDQQGPTSFIIDYDEYKVDEIITNSVDLNLFDNKVSPQANCAKRLNTEAIDVKVTDCILLVKVEDYKEYKNLSVSIDGRNGNFQKNKFEWDASQLSGTPYNVWVKADDQPAVPYRFNQDREIPICLPPDQPEQTGQKASQAPVNKEIDQIKVEIAQAATKFGANPGDRKASSELQSLCMNTLPNPPSFVVDGQNYTGYSAFSNALRISNRNEGATYVLVSPPEVKNKAWLIKYKKQ